MNSRAKGCRGERQLRDQLREAGFPARRGQQFSGDPSAPDVICESLPLHWEVKRVQAGNLYTWLDQAIRDSSGQKTPVVAHKKNGREWVAILRLSDFLEIMQHSDLIIPPTKTQKPRLCDTSNAT